MRSVYDVGVFGCVAYTGVPQFGQNACARLFPLSAVFTYVETAPLIRKSSASARTDTRYADPDNVWQSVQ
jgi:hypothetical protein